MSPGVGEIFKTKNFTYFVLLGLMVPLAIPQNLAPEGAALDYAGADQTRERLPRVDVFWLRDGDCSRV